MATFIKFKDVETHGLELRRMIAKRHDNVNAEGLAWIRKRAI
ncbi:hypothetical protein [Chromobacterium violaceum]|nr:hypothetical protein [Chromobacterium violaceum]